MEFAIADIFLTFLGWTFLLLKYRNLKKMESAKNQFYDGSFVVAGRTVALQTLLIILGLMTIAISFAIFTGELRE